MINLLFQNQQVINLHGKHGKNGKNVHMLPVEAVNGVPLFRFFAEKLCKLVFKDLGDRFFGDAALFCNSACGDVLFLFGTC